MRRRNGCLIIYDPCKTFYCRPYRCCDYNPEGPQTWQVCPHCKSRGLIGVCTNPRARRDAETKKRGRNAKA